MESLDAPTSDNAKLAIVWTTLPDIADVKPAGLDDVAVFAEVREVLERHGVTQRFGLNLLHRHFALADDECILETTDIANRRQVTEVRKCSELAGQTVIETQWMFGANATVFCVGFCNYDRGHKHLHNQR